MRRGLRAQHAQILALLKPESINPNVISEVYDVPILKKTEHLDAYAREQGALISELELPEPKTPEILTTQFSQKYKTYKTMQKAWEGSRHATNQHSNHYHYGQTRKTLGTRIRFEVKDF